MKWDKSNAEPMMALASLYHSGLWGARIEDPNERPPDAARISPHTRPSSSPRKDLVPAAPTVILDDRAYVPLANLLGLI
jgi:hypothetical protein